MKMGATVSLAKGTGDNEISYHIRNAIYCENDGNFIEAIEHRKVLVDFHRDMGNIIMVRSEMRDIAKDWISQAEIFENKGEWKNAKQAHENAAKVYKELSSEQTTLAKKAQSISIRK